MSVVYDLTKKIVSAGGKRRENHRDISDLILHCRDSRSNVDIVYHELLKHLRESNSASRFFAFQIAEMFFERSGHFRDLLLAEIQLFAQMTVGLPDHPLPNPKPYATKLREASRAALKRWFSEFGQFYKQLDVAYRQLVNLGVSFSNDDIHFNPSDREREMRTRIINMQIYNVNIQELEEESPAILENLQRMSACFEILSENSEKHSADEYNAESEENAIVFDSLRESLKVLNNRHRALVEKWVKAIARTDGERQTEYVRRAIDIRDQLNKVKEQADIFLRNQDNDDDDGEFDDEVFEEVVQLPKQKDNRIEETGSIPACRARLKNGLLCPRRDLKKCPLHGFIIERDDNGDPVDPSQAPPQTRKRVQDWELLAADVAAAIPEPSTGKKAKRKPLSFLAEELKKNKKKRR